jgi:glycosyltransferase involved in cell wall biosynthesis
MRITYLNPTGILGGAELCLLDLLASLRSARPDWALSVVLGEDGPLREEVEARGAACSLAPMPGGLTKLGDAGLGQRGGTSRLALAARAPAVVGPLAAYLGRLKRTLRGLAPDVLQTNGMKAHVLGAWAAPKGVPVVWHLHDYTASRPVMARLLRLSARRRGISAVAVSRSVADDAKRALGGRVPVHAIYNAIDLDRFSPGPGDGPALDIACGLPVAPEGTVRVGLVATFARWKGQDVFLEAAARPGAETPCRFYIIGGPIYRSLGSQWSFEELKERAGSLGVGFAGFQSDPASSLRALDIVVHASTRPEPFGRVVVEGMACGRAVVAVREGGSAELFEDGVSALGVPRDDPAALAAAIARLAADPELRRRLGDAGRAETVARFDRNRLASEWAAVYHEALGVASPDSLSVNCPA